MKTDFLIFYEHVNREVENDTLIKYELNKRGYSCEIMPFDGPEYFSRVLLRKKAKVLVVPWLRTDTNIYHYHYLAKKPYKFVNLQWEQISNKGIRACGIDTYSENAANSYHLCWGDFSQDILIAKGGKKEKLPVVGAIQQDYNREIFKDYYLKKEDLAKKYSLDETKPWILYVSSFSLANASKQYIDELTSKYGEYFENAHKLNVESQNITLEWIQRLIEKYDCEFIYRPHPTETSSPRLVNMKKEYKNFHIVSEHSVKQWAKVCNKVNLWISTSNAELLAMDVKYNVVRPIELRPEQEMESMFGEQYITTYEEFKKSNINGVTEADIELIKKRKENISKFYDYDDTVPAYSRVADALEKVLLNEGGTSYFFDSSQRKKSRKIFVRTVVFSMFMNMCKISELLIKVLPIKKEWKRLVYAKTKEYRRGKNVEKDMLRYLNKYGE